MHFLLKVCCWQYCQLSAPRRTLHPTWPHKACRLVHKIKQGYVTYQIPVSCVGHKRLRVPVTASLIIMAKSWILTGLVKILQTDSLRLSSFHKATRRNPNTQWITKPVQKHSKLQELTSTSLKNHGLGKGDKFHSTTGGSHYAAGRWHGILQLHHFC
ncbi:hypothetical protein FD755_020456 [Muntiacus reevesi]|uniref:Ribosomal protein L15 n=1 Tax=Muntiacus reevesi TaxID=9886 RepID=A0A5N3WZ22_MUNRE|nr:hypothetical protein FD755_020456 [Muntiacus reevesi]